MVTSSSKQTQYFPADSVDFDVWIAHVGVNRSAADITLLHQAYSKMDSLINHQQDMLGDKELTRSLLIAEILANLHIDTNTLLATMLHSLVISCDVSSDEIAEEFGVDVAHLINGINKMRIVDARQVHNLDEKPSTNSVEQVRKLLLALAEDIRVVLIKIAERLYTMRKLKFFADDVKRQIATETKDIFSPLASRLGIWQIKWELEDLSFRYLEPETYKHIASMLDERRIDRERFISEIIIELKNDLDCAGIKADVTGRPKHIYSIWRKMKAKNVGFNELFDVRATRVLVNSVADCYAVLGIVHNKWRPIRSEFDDYIATPKENNYRSLHTAVIGPNNKTLEVQIRTIEMHEHSEYGVASHWGYKEGGKHDVKYQEKMAWLRQLLELKDDDTGDIIERFKAEVFEDRVYILTPKGQIIDVPKGATALDFAYYVHTEIGHHYRGAKVDGKIVPISYELKNGQQIEILTSKHSQPSRDWLNPHLGYIKCSRTRAKVRSWFKQQDFDRNVDAGRTMFERELHRLGIAKVQYEQVAQKFSYLKVDDFFAALGRGDLTTVQVANAVHELIFPVVDLMPETPVLALRPPTSQSYPDNIQIMGVGDLMTHTALCCKPVPYDLVVGYITRGRGVTVHRRDCPNVLRLLDVERERVISVSWGGAQTRKTYPVDIVVTAFDRQGLLRDITTLLTNSHLNVLSMNSHTDKKTYTATFTFTIEVADVDQLSIALTKIEHLQNIMQVTRKKS
ncbi:MAG: bifunctional (p)ppGpp synthetase/guanosine-3',5'-bis(diphosphate) 3'-pyrophosphohydrolase [Gammaproteobacteria bacterium]|nr:bifunctional (p)ppGpp synthetase/guanosine-3',5'-bis(diphosphate) 3'-pyrophosphohydrolase [Gammaproteobacteria bacterium]